MIDHTYIITMCNPPPPPCLSQLAYIFHYSMMSHPYIILVILCRVHGCALIAQLYNLYTKHFYLYIIVHNCSSSHVSYYPMSCSYTFCVLVSISCLCKLSLIDNTSMFVSSELSVSVVPDRPLNLILLTHYND